MQEIMAARRERGFYYLGVRKGELKVKIALRYFFFHVQSQIAVWTLKRMRLVLFPLRMHIIREHAHG